MAQITGASSAGGWYPDPENRFEQRYFDGERWTEHVFSSGRLTDSQGQTRPSPPAFTQQAEIAPRLVATPSGGTNGFAIASMVLGIVWVYWIGSILALVFGYIAKRQIEERGETGKGMATAGIVLGYVGLGFFAVLFLLLLVT